jgi:hypothetical protein
MQALIIRDPYESEESYLDLLNLLKDFKIFEISSIRHFDEFKYKLSYDEPCLFFVNTFTRFEKFQEIINFHKKNNFSGITINKQVVSFLPSSTHLNENKNFLLCPGNIFKLSNMSITHYKNNSNTTTLFTLTYGRNDYLKLSLNSLIHNVDKSCNIKIGLNSDDPVSEKILMEYQDKYDFIEVLKFNKNSYISGFNLLYQIFKPSRFIVFEDDFILPDSFSKYYPNWHHEFIHRLDYFDVVTMGATLDNAPYEWGVERNILKGYTQRDWEIIDESNKKFLMGQLFSIKSDFYLDIIRKYISDPSENNTKKYYTPTDKEIYRESSKISSPSLRGYHIGWNESMDGLRKSYDKYQKPEDNYIVKSLKTSKVYNLEVKGILYGGSF